MDSENKFWLGFWTIIAFVLVVFAVSALIYNMSYNVKYFEAWKTCVEAGGQPINQTMLGTQTNTFTCVRK
jgi:LPS O-antigen subunit length determinant protein (WzzB/FepE family)